MLASTVAVAHCGLPTASVFQQFATAHGSWFMLTPTQAVALLLLRDVARTHTDAFLAARAEALPLMLALESSQVSDVAGIAKDAVQQIGHLPAVQRERVLQVCI